MSFSAIKVIRKEESLIGKFNFKKLLGEGLKRKKTSGIVFQIFLKEVISDESDKKRYKCN